MPTYSYTCQHCQVTVDETRRMSERNDPAVCQECNGLMDRTLSSMGRHALDYIVNDRHYEGLRATDGTPINSRKKHQEYMKRHNLTTMDDFTGVWDKAAQERATFFTKGGTIKRQDIERAIFELNEKGRRP